jgi:hypothetical protein
LSFSSASSPALTAETLSDKIEVLIWRFSPSESHVVELAFNEETQKVVGILWPYNEHRKFLLILDLTTGHLHAQNLRRYVSATEGKGP